MLSIAPARQARRRVALQARLATVLAVLEPVGSAVRVGAPAGAAVPVGAPAGTADFEQLQARLHPHLRSDRPDVLWLALATITGILPLPDEVTEAARSCDFDGPRATLAAILASARPDASKVRGEWAQVEVALGTRLVDLHHTSRTTLATGIQRVARQAARRWNADHEITLVGWSRGFTHLIALSPELAAVALYGDANAAPAHQSSPEVVLVPWHGTYVLPELMTERTRALRLQALIRFSNSRTAAIGFDCVPLTSAETIGDGMGAAFAVNLTALARMDLIVTISEAAATEYRGWRAMLAGAGLAGPEIIAVDLAVQASAATEQAIAAVRRDMVVGALRMVLVVGSHEPRKNHLAILHAAECLWREGQRFSLTFIGGNSWNGAGFTARLAQLQAVGRPVETVSAVSEEILWAAYEVAHFTVFPSLNEGFGLPVAESLATGTPVITANFGSMRDIAAAGGALLIDPASDREIAEAMRTLLTDASVHAQLGAQASTVRIKPWDTYASEVWQHLVQSEDAPVALSAALENGIR